MSDQVVTIQIQRNGQLIEGKSQFPDWITAASDVAGVAYELAIELNEQLLRLEK